MRVDVQDEQFKIVDNLLSTIFHEEVDDEFQIIS